MEYNFKRFTKTGSKLGNYTISITGGFAVGFNSGFYNKENVGKYKKVVFFADKPHNTIAFQFTNDENSEGVFTIIHHKGGSTGAASARSFLTDFGIRKEQLKKYVPEKINDPSLGTLFVIKMQAERTLSI